MTLNSWIFLVTWQNIFCEMLSALAIRVLRAFNDHMNPSLAGERVGDKYGRENFGDIF